LERALYHIRRIYAEEDSKAPLYAALWIFFGTSEKINRREDRRSSPYSLQEEDRLL
jgi:hypothetical protein